MPSRDRTPCSTYTDSYRGRAPKAYRAASADRVRIQHNQAKSPKSPAPGRPLSPQQLVREYVLAEREQNRGGFRRPSVPLSTDPPGSLPPRHSTAYEQYARGEDDVEIPFSTRINGALGPSGSRSPTRPPSPRPGDMAPPPTFTSLVDYVGPNWSPPSSRPAPPPSRSESAAVPLAKGGVWTPHVPRSPSVVQGAVTSGGAWSFVPRPPASAKPGGGQEVQATPLMPPYAPPPRSIGEGPAGDTGVSFAPPFPPGVPYVVLAVPQAQPAGADSEQTEEDRQEEEKKSDPHWSVWVDNSKKVTGTPPLPPKLKPRPHTSTGVRPQPRPAPVAPPPDTQQLPYYVLATEQGPARGSPVTFVPELQSWTNASTDYEKDVAARIAMYRSASLDRGLTSLGITPRAPPYMPSRSLTHWGGFPGDLDPRGHYAQTMLPYAGAAIGGPREDRIIRSMARNMSGADPMPSMGLLTNRRESRPKARYGYRGCRPFQHDDYVHDLSCFTNTSPMTSGYYIIHPDWVSERLTLKRAASLQALNA